MYYDVVVSIYDESGKNDIRIDSYLICGGFKTEDEAMDYINNNEINEYKYCYSDNEYPCIEIEEHDENGTVISVNTVD